MSDDPRHNRVYPHPKNPGLAEEPDGFYDWAGRRLFLADGSPDPMTPGAYRYQTRPDLCDLDAPDSEPASPRYEPMHLRHKPGDDWLIDRDRPYDVLDPGPFGSPGWFPDRRTGRHRRDELPDPIPWWEIEEEPEKREWAENAEALLERRTRVTRAREAAEAGRASATRNGASGARTSEQRSARGRHDDSRSGLARRGDHDAHHGVADYAGHDVHADHGGAADHIDHDGPAGHSGGAGAGSGSGLGSGFSSGSDSGFGSGLGPGSGSGSGSGSDPGSGSSFGSGLGSSSDSGFGSGSSSSSSSGPGFGFGPGSARNRTRAHRHAGDSTSADAEEPGLRCEESRPRGDADRPSPRSGHRTGGRFESSGCRRVTGTDRASARPMEGASSTEPMEHASSAGPSERVSSPASCMGTAASEGGAVDGSTEEPYRFSKLREDAWDRFLDKSSGLAAAHHLVPNGATTAFDRECGPVIALWIRLVRWVFAVVRARGTAAACAAPDGAAPERVASDPAASGPTPSGPAAPDRAAAAGFETSLTAKDRSGPERSAPRPVAPAARTAHAVRTARFAQALRGAQRARTESVPDPERGAAPRQHWRGVPEQRRARESRPTPFLADWERHFDAHGALKGFLRSAEGLGGRPGTSPAGDVPNEFGGGVAWA